MLKVFPFLFLLLQGINIYSQSIEYARSIINTLASKEYMGRGYVANADLKAAKFIRNEFRLSGLDSLGKNYFQPFKIDVNTFPGEMDVQINGASLKPGDDYIIDPTSPSIKGNFAVIRCSRSDLLDQQKLNLIFSSIKGKALLIDLNDSIIYSGEESAKIKQIINLIKFSKDLNNSLTILYTKERLIWSISDWQSEKPVILINSSVINSNEIFKITVDIQANYLKKYKTQNIVGMIRGSSNNDSFLVITAHYDHLGIMGKNTIFPGANDNASGIAMILNLARYYSINPPKYNTVFIAFSAEELGLLGADFFAHSTLLEIKKIKFLINFDLAGTGDEGIKVVNATIFKQEFEKLQKINSENHFLPSIMARGEACISDHCLFFNRNVPCFYIYTLGGISAYHDIYDKAETLPLTEFGNYLKLMTTFLNSF